MAAVNPLVPPIPSSQPKASKRPNSLLTKVTSRIQQIHNEINLDRDFDAWSKQNPRGDFIAGGSYGKVHLTPKKTRVMKWQSPHKRSHPNAYLEVAKAEAELHQSLNGTPHLPYLFDARSSNKRVALVLENAGDTIYRTYLDRSNPNKKIATIQDVERLGKVLLEFLSSIHKKNIGHFDLKPENMSDTSIFDLGLATQVPPEGTKGLRVSSHYRPLEIMINLQYGTKADIWSSACILFELLTGDSLFPIPDGNSRAEQIQADINRMHVFQYRLGSMDLSFLKLSPKASQFLDKKDDGTEHLKPTTYQYRLRRLEETIEAKMEPGARRDQFIDLLRNMLVYDPSKRFNAVQCLEHPFFSSASSTDCTLKLDVVHSSPLSIQIQNNSGNILHTIKLDNPNGCYHILKSPYQYSIFFIDPATNAIVGCSEFYAEHNSVLVINPEDFSSYTLPSIVEADVPKLMGSRRRLNPEIS
jgi:serine/threonine protein kinase